MEQQRKEKAEAQLYTILKVARDEDLLEQIGRDRYFDLVDHDKVHSFRVQKQMPFNHFKEEAAKEFGIPVQFQRFWLWAKRQNLTYRPHRPLTPEQEAQPVGQLRDVSLQLKNGKLNLFLEVELGQGLRRIPPPVQSNEDILLFFKLYDPLKEELRYVGRLFVKASGKPVEILAKLNEMAGFAPGEEIKLFEEIKFEPIVMCEHVDRMITFHDSQLENGDIICFQKSPQFGNSEHCSHPDVPSFLNWVRHYQALQPTSGTQTPSNNASHHGSSEATPVVDSTTVTGPFDDAAPADKVRFLAYWVSSDASLLLKRIHGLHKATFTKFSMKGQTLQTTLLESLASFIQSMSTMKVNAVDREMLRLASVSIDDFEQVGLDLWWLKRRLDEAKRVNKHSESLTFVDLCESALNVGRAKVRELEQGLVKAKAEVEDSSRDLPDSLGVDDSLLKDVV